MPREKRKRPLTIQYLPPSIDQFRSALIARNRTAALLAWGKTSSEDHTNYATFNGLDTDLLLMVDVIDAQTIGVMKALGVSFAGRPRLAQRVLEAPHNQWVDALTHAGGPMWQSFVTHIAARREA